ncbi:hypothetical protein EDD21DRAFT_371580 [Dissophora ornata]|nr:hypothetical protein BGZ58_006557 [Dissophora ornata]KAI8602533.1 hypothetical protein EDD21DRAFT_371580 [Dissophora ornata]
MQHNTSLATRSTQMMVASKSCNANGGQGCSRGFVRDRCRKCDMGSVACDMCQRPPSTITTTPTSTTTNPLYRKSKKIYRLSYTSPSTTGPSSSLAFPSRRSLSFEPSATQTSVSATPPLAMPRRLPPPPLSGLSSKLPSPTSISFPKSSPPSSPTSPSTTFATPPPTPTSCIFCRNGRKACEDCFGLGYVQRVCQDCIRESHRHHNSSGGGAGGVRKASLPASWNQVGGWGLRLKEQLITSTQRSSQQQHSQSPSRLQPDVLTTPLDESKSNPNNNAKMSVSREDSEDSSNSGHVSDSSSKSGRSNTNNTNNNARISFKATVRKHLKVPPLFSHNNNKAERSNGNDSNRKSKSTGTVKDKNHGRQWSLSTLLTPSLRAASSAA